MEGQVGTTDAEGNMPVHPWGLGSSGWPPAGQQGSLPPLCTHWPHTQPLTCLPERSLSWEATPGGILVFWGDPPNRGICGLSEGVSVCRAAPARGWGWWLVAARRTFHDKSAQRGRQSGSVVGTRGDLGWGWDTCAGPELLGFSEEERGPALKEGEPAARAQC